MTRPSFSLPRVDDSAGKESRGRVLVVGGSTEIPGAVLLAGMAALRVGAGKLQMATAASVARLMAIAMPEARVMPLQETDAGSVAYASPALLEASERADALILDPDAIRRRYGSNWWTRCWPVRKVLSCLTLARCLPMSSIRLRGVAS